MRAFKYLLAFWTAFAVYSVFSLLNGVMGLSAYDKLSAEREKQWENMKKLGLLNEELENTKNSLLYDRDTLAVYARQLGYGHEDERFIRIVGLGGIKNPHTETGRVVLAESSEFIPDGIIKIGALCAGLAVFAFLFILEILRSRSCL
ncbi:MAG: septum formation initiator family protein [Treponema sp.]|jgi:cell division protein FtsB|nr:septum formation initiator family protein [Treponema sp.]